MFCMQALVCLVFDPMRIDDETCDHYVTESRCTEPYILQDNFGKTLGKRCEWDEGSHCDIRSPSRAVWSLAVGACVAALLSIPVIQSVRYILRYYVFVPTLREREKNDWEQHDWILHFFPTCLIKWIAKQRRDPYYNYASYFDFLNISKEYEYVLEAVDSDFELLETKVVEHELSMLAPRARNKFTSSWGYEKAAHVKQNQKEVATEDGFSLAQKKLILEDLERVHFEIAKEQAIIATTLRYENYPLDEFRVLRLLLSDLMSNYEGDIFEWKWRRDYEMSGSNEPKYIGVRILGASVVLLYIWLAIVFIFYFAYTRVEELQQLWFYSLLTWAMFEMIFFRPLTVMMTDVLIPSLISHKLERVKALVKRCIVNLDSFNEDKSKFKWSLLLYASARVAGKFYSSRLGALILSMSLNIPRRSVDIDSYPTHALATLDVTNNNGYMLGPIGVQEASAWYMAVVSYLFKIPIIGDVIMEILAVGFLSVFLLLHVRLYIVHGYIAVIPTGCVLLLLIVSPYFCNLKSVKQWRGKVHDRLFPEYPDDEEYPPSESSERENVKFVINGDSDSEDELANGDNQIAPDLSGGQDVATPAADMSGSRKTQRRSLADLAFKSFDATTNMKDGKAKEDILGMASMEGSQKEDSLSKPRGLDDNDASVQDLFGLMDDMLLPSGDVPVGKRKSSHLTDKVAPIERGMSLDSRNRSRDRMNKLSAISPGDKRDPSLMRQRTMPDRTTFSSSRKDRGERRDVNDLLAMINDVSPPGSPPDIGLNSVKRDRSRKVESTPKAKRTISKRLSSLVGSEQGGMFDVTSSPLKTPGESSEKRSGGELGRRMTLLDDVLSELNTTPLAGDNSRLPRDGEYEKNRSSEKKKARDRSTEEQKKSRSSSKKKEELPRSTSSSKRETKRSDSRKSPSIRDDGDVASIAAIAKKSFLNDDLDLDVDSALDEFDSKIAARASRQKSGVEDEEFAGSKRPSSSKAARVDVTRMTMVGGWDDTPVKTIEKNAAPMPSQGRIVTAMSSGEEVPEYGDLNRLRAPYAAGSAVKRKESIIKAKRMSALLQDIEDLDSDSDEDN
jgi:hypothetical protein